MIGYIIRKFIGSKNDRDVKRLRPIVAKVVELEATFQNLTEADLQKKTADLKARLSQITDKDELARALDEALPEAYAMVKNACRRLCGREIIVRGHPLKWEMVPFDVQILGGIGLHQGKIAEMATGEGKTLVATFPVFLNALTGRGVHVVTVNDYLAARDSEWMGAVYRLLGLTVGCILHDQSPEVRRQQYNCDITYGTNAEFGFDYLRDNGMASRVEEQVQRGHYFAIIDEVDSILIDEARVPLIISGPAVVHQDSKYAEIKPAIESLVRNQQRLCNRYLDEAEELTKKLGASDAEVANNRQAIEDQIGTLLYRVKLGQPRSERLMRLLEDPENLRRMTKIDLELHGDQSKKALYREKEELFFAIEEKSHEADLTEKGRQFLSPNDPDAFVLPDLITAYHEIDQTNADLKTRMQQKAKVQQVFEGRAEQIHSISQLLKAYCLYQKDVQYVVQDNKVIIVDENTGRLMVGRRWSDGLHQAVEAKEGVEIERETQTFATITIQNYFRLYTKLAGMTGTAETEAGEFWDIYKLGVLVIPTNRQVARKDKHDTVYKSKREKYAAVLKEIQTIHAEGRPILVGTISVEVSELLSRMLSKAGIPHNVLNAKQHEREAEIVALAGQRGAVTIATNMAGRGTDIKLGPGVADLGGLHVVATERHESRRIDRQLRGRCARQGDPGSSHFFVSLEDDLMRLFGSDRIGKIMEKVGLEEGQELEHPLLNRSIETAQKRVEQHNFQMRKRTLEYDDVMNKQREVIYGFRNEIMRAEDVRDRLMDVMEEVVIQKITLNTTADTLPDDWDLRALTDWVNLNFVLAINEEELRKVADSGKETPVEGSIYDGLNPAQFAVCTFLQDQIREAYKIKISYENPEVLARIERYTILSAIDKLWQEHLYNMDSLRHSIGLRSYGQRDPLIEYKAEAFKMFEELMVSIKSEICHNIFRSASSLMAFEQFLQNLPKRMQQLEVSAFGPGHSTTANAPTGGSDVVSEVSQEVSKAKPVRTGPKVGRNDLCPCGSGKKFKSCCGKTL
ncbi:MAG TPA: preprotein translocase subunit SecA [Methylomirabilota bacterium]|nr:preprotein translocase subunit SecA [Methylomirabilota bacterium]